MFPVLITIPSLFWALKLKKKLRLDARDNQNENDRITMKNRIHLSNSVPLVGCYVQDQSIYRLPCCYSILPNIAWECKFVNDNMYRHRFLTFVLQMFNPARNHPISRTKVLEYPSSVHHTPPTGEKDVDMGQMLSLCLHFWRSRKLPLPWALLHWPALACEH